MKNFRGKPIVRGEASGKSLVSFRPFTFAHGVDPATGRVTDVRSDIRGEVVRGRILVYLYGKGSTTASAWFLETSRLGNNPHGIIIKNFDNGTIVGSILSNITYNIKIPVILVEEEEFYREASQANLVRIHSTGDINLE